MTRFSVDFYEDGEGVPDIRVSANSTCNTELLKPREKYAIAALTAASIRVLNEIWPPPPMAAGAVGVTPEQAEVMQRAAMCGGAK